MADGITYKGVAARFEVEITKAVQELEDTIATVKAALKAVNAANKSDLTIKIDEADAALQATIDALSNELDATNEKGAELETFTVIVYVLYSVAFCGCGTLAIFYFINKKKSSNK